MRTHLFVLAALLPCATLIGAQAAPRAKNVAKPVTLTGLVAGAPRGNTMRLRVNGQIVQVNVASGAQLQNVRGGDRVRAFGKPLGQTLIGARVRVLATAASTTPEDYEETSPQPVVERGGRTGGPATSTRANTARNTTTRSNTARTTTNGSANR